jgi:hypothetical protein
LSNQRSKWSDYQDDVSEKEEETLLGGNYSYSHCFTPDAKDNTAAEQLVEDEVHPDFL